VAISVWLSSGKACQWSAPWECIVSGAGGGLLADLETCGDPEQVSASFVYGVRESLVELFDKPREQPGRFANLPTGLDLAAILKGDLTRIHSEKNKAGHGRVADALARLSQRHRRSVDSNGRASIHPDQMNFSFDGLRLSRFLARLKESTTQGTSP